MQDNEGIDSPTEDNLLLWTRSLLFTLILNAGSIFVMFSTGPNSPSLFSDFDEPFYFSLARQVGAAPLLETLRTIPALPDSVMYRKVFYPHSLIDILFGKILFYSGMPFTVFGLILDLLLPIFAYYLFVKFFRELNVNRWATECATIGVLAFPYLAAVTSYFHLPVHLGFIESVPSGVYPCVPILRGIYTQMSILLYPLGLLLAAKAFKADRSDALRLFAFAGLCAGLSIYVYFYCWMALSGLIVLWILCDTLLYRQQVKEKFVQVLIFLATSILSALPGVLILHGVKNTAPSFIPQSAFNLVYVPLEICGLLICLFLSRKYWQYRPVVAKLLTVLMACWLSIFLVPNLQFFLRAPLLGFHFITFYFTPLATGIIIAFILNRSFSKNILVAIYCVLLASCVANYKSGWRNIDEQFIDLANFVNANVAQDATIAATKYFSPRNRGNDIFTLSYSALPYYIETLLQRKSFLSPFKEGDSDEALKAELATGFYTLGNVVFTADCLNRSDIKLPGDLAIHFNVEVQLNWARFCERSKLLSYSICELIHQFPADYILVGLDSNTNIPEWYTWGAERIWESGTHEIALYKVKSKALEQRFCNEQFPHRQQGN